MVAMVPCCILHWVTADSLPYLKHILPASHARGPFLVLDGFHLLRSFHLCLFLPLFVAAGWPVLRFLSRVKHYYCTT